MINNSIHIILLIVPIKIISTERSFSKLKLLKSYMRPIIFQERLNILALISVDNEFLENIDYKIIIDEVASKNIRRSLEDSNVWYLSSFESCL